MLASLAFQTFFLLIAAAVVKLVKSPSSMSNEHDEMKVALALMSLVMARGWSI